MSRNRLLGRMSQQNLSVWFVCRLCRGSFGQVDAFIEHKKQKHFTQFQNTTSIVFEERELGLICPVGTSGNHQLEDEILDPLIKVEINDNDPINQISYEIIDDPNLDLVEPKSELITYECELDPDIENHVFGLKQPEQNPYVLLERLTSEEIQSACVPQHYSKLSKCESKNFASNSDPPDLSVDVDRNASYLIKVEKRTENELSATVGYDSSEDKSQFECKLCSKQLQSDGHLKIHVGICALYHKDRNRFCVTCNRKFYDTFKLKDHRLTFHGTEEERSSLFKFKCHVCPKRYRVAGCLRNHVETHKQKKPQVRTSNSKLFQCSDPYCGKEFRSNSDLQRHISNVHLRLRPFSCSFPNCNKTFAQRTNMEIHFVTHTGERPFKCTVDNCDKRFSYRFQRSRHHRKVHANSCAMELIGS